MFVRAAALFLSGIAVVVWTGFGAGMVFWGLTAERTFALQSGAPQQAAAAAYSASVSIIAYALARAVTGALRVVVDELRAWDRRPGPADPSLDEPDPGSP